MQAFGDGYDLYAALADMSPTYWDSGSVGGSLVAGRFTGSRAWQLAANQSNAATKSSGQNDAVHHITVAHYWNGGGLSGTNLGAVFTLSDGANAQCTVAFRIDGTILLLSGNINGAALATYTGAINAITTWFSFEIEVVINNTTGSFTVRTNGSPTNSFQATGLNTRAGSTNNYANRLVVASGTTTLSYVDDFLWRSDPSSVPWVGDIRCYTRMPASDAQAQFSKSPATTTLSPVTINAGLTVSAGNARYVAFTATYDGTIGTATVSMSTGYTGNMKCSIFLSVGGVPTTALGSATPLSNPATGVNTITFPTPVSVSKGGTYFIAVDSDTTSGNWNGNNNASTGLQSTTPYASFPAANPSTSNNNAVGLTITITVGTNNCLVNEAQEDGATSYVYDSNVGDADFYAIAALAGTPASTVCVTTRGFFEKSDAGTRSGAVQLKSGTTTVASTSTALATSWGWLWRTDLNDPNTGAAWTATAVNNAQIGPTVTA